MNQEFKDALDDSPIIAAIKDNNGLKKCLTSSSSVIFILYGDICNISDIVDEVKKAGKIAMVHIDLINGLSSKEITVDFIKKYTNADGIISTKPTLIKRARELSLYTILRLFVIDSMAYEKQAGLSLTKRIYLRYLMLVQHVFLPATKMCGFCKKGNSPNALWQWSYFRGV